MELDSFWGRQGVRAWVYIFIGFDKNNAYICMSCADHDVRLRKREGGSGIMEGIE